MLGLTLRLTGIFSFFRIPYNSLLMDTYLFPPKTTVIGMIGAAIGWNEDEFLENIKNFRYGLIIENHGEVLTETAAIYKSKEAPRYPITKNMVYMPVYKVFLSSKDDNMVKEAHDAIRDPKFVLTLGDSENLFYPTHTNPNFVTLLEIKEKPAEKLNCILPSDIYNEYHSTFSRIKDDFLPPRETKIPVDFVGKGRSRRFVPLNVFYYSGVELRLKKPIKKGVFDFDGDAVYLF
ncbi:MAG: CRISPR-associated protein Cas5 [Promethearchaeati archaeon SRVP18_Atabeyarchaeia-1]